MGPGGGSSQSGTSPHPASPCCCPAMGPGGGSSQSGTSPHRASPCCCPAMGTGGGSSRSGTSPHLASPCCCPAMAPEGGSSQRGGTSPHPASPCCSPKDDEHRKELDDPVGPRGNRKNVKTDHRRGENAVQQDPPAHRLVNRQQNDVPSPRRAGEARKHPKEAKTADLSLTGPSGLLWGSIEKPTVR